MKNITIAVKPEIHRRARIRAAELDLSLSGYVATLIAKDEATQPAASPIEEVLALRQQMRGFIPGPKISRDELHERHRLR